MKTQNKHFIAAVAICVFAVVLCMRIWPGARYSFVLPSYCVILAIVLAVFSRCGWRSRKGAYLLLAMTTLSVCGAIINVNYYTTFFSASLESPVLFNDDASTDWNMAMYNLGLGDGSGIWCFGMRRLADIAAGLMWVFGVDITVPAMFSVFCYPLSLMAMGSVAWTVTRDKRVAFATLVISSLMCYLFCQSTWFIKDVPVTLCMAVCALVMARWRERGGVNVVECVLIACAMLLLVFLRANFMFTVALGAILLMVGRKRFFDTRYVTVVVVAMVLYLFYQNFFEIILPDKYITVDGSTLLNAAKPASAAWDAMHDGDYVQLPFWKQLLFLPLSVVVQFLVPFPWNFSRDMIFGPVFVVAHFGYFWYYAGALILYWLFAAWKDSPQTMRRLALWGIIMTVLTAWISAGRVSRYCLPYLPLLLPCAAFVAVNFYKRKSLWIWLGVFTALLIPTLIVCHHLQMSAS